jgi:LPPG:FO 2-phospho-L-lactate transferase
MGNLHIVALAGGVGGAKLADGLAQVLQPDQLTIVVNTGDDFTHLGLRISPDLDTVCYTLAGLANNDTGWGRANETWNVLNQLKKMGMPDWFQIGDSDLVTHLVRTIRFNEGWTLSQITQDFCRIWDVRVQILPMSDQVIQTHVLTRDGDMEFQEYFVHQKCTPIVSGFNFVGIKEAKPAPGVLEAINSADAVVVCPSNPWVSIDPILSVPNIQEALEGHIVIAVSPIIGNQTFKGPAAKMFSELGIEPSPYTVAQHYASTIDCIIIDNSDKLWDEKIRALDIRTHLTDIYMNNRVDRCRLATELIEIIYNWEKVI